MTNPVREPAVSRDTSRDPSLDPSPDLESAAAILPGMSNRALASRLAPTVDPRQALASRLAPTDDPRQALTEAAAALPRFRAAVDGLLPVTAALEARAVIAGLQRAAKGTAEADRPALDELTARVPNDLGPRVFRGKTITGDPAAAGLASAAAEAAATLELVNTVTQVRALVHDGKADSLRAAADLVETWRGRPVNFLFLYAALEQENLIAPLALLPGSATGLNIFEQQLHAETSAKEFGALADTGDFDLTKALALLTPRPEQTQAFKAPIMHGPAKISEENAARVAEMWSGAAPNAQGPILERLESAGKLGLLCRSLPGRPVSHMISVLARANPKSPALATLNANLPAQPEGTTVTELYEQNIMADLHEGKNVRAYLWTLLNVAHSSLTLGFKDIHDQAYVRWRAGEITENEYFSTATKAAGRSAALFAITAMTGGMAGGLAEGMALGRGVGPVAASLIGGASGGAVSSVAGQFTGDVYDQALLGKQGFSSAGDYVTSAAVGAASSVVTSAVGAYGPKAGDRIGAAAGKSFGEELARPGETPAEAQARLGQTGSAAAMETFRYGAGGGRYAWAEDFRRSLHRLLYDTYRASAHAGRRLGSGGATTPNASLFRPEQIHHVVGGDDGDYGGHLWPPNPAGGTNGDPKTPFARTTNENEVIDFLAEVFTDPATVWTQQSGPGQGSKVTGLPTRPPTTNKGAAVRYSAEVTFKKLTIKIVAEPGGKGLVTAHPIGFQDPADLYDFIQLDTSSGESEE